MCGCSASLVRRRDADPGQSQERGQQAFIYDPEMNRSYAKMAAHYNVGMVPARPRKPKDKAAVEAGVRFA